MVDITSRPITLNNTLLEGVVDKNELIEEILSLKKMFHEQQTNIDYLMKKDEVKLQSKPKKAKYTEKEQSNKENQPNQENAPSPSNPSLTKSRKIINAEATELDENLVGKKKNLLNDISQVVVNICLANFEKVLQRHRDLVEIRISHLEDKFKGLEGGFTSTTPEKFLEDRSLISTLVASNFHAIKEELASMVDKNRKELDVKLNEFQLGLTSGILEKSFRKSIETNLTQNDQQDISSSSLLSRVNLIEKNMDEYFSYIRSEQVNCKIKIEEKYEYLWNELSKKLTKLEEDIAHINQVENKDRTKKPIFGDARWNNENSLFTQQLIKLKFDSIEKDFKTVSEKVADLKLEIFKNEEDNVTQHRQNTSILNDIWNTLGIMDSKIEQIMLPKKKKSKTFLKEFMKK